MTVISYSSRMHVCCGCYVVRIIADMCVCLMIRRPPRSTLDRSSAASDVYKRQEKVVDRDEVEPGRELEPERRFGDRDEQQHEYCQHCLLYTSPSPRDRTRSRMPSSA